MNVTGTLSSCSRPSSGACAHAPGASRCRSAYCGSTTLRAHDKAAPKGGGRANARVRAGHAYLLPPQTCNTAKYGWQPTGNQHARTCLPRHCRGAPQSRRSSAAATTRRDTHKGGRAHVSVGAPVHVQSIRTATLRPTHTHIKSAARAHLLQPPAITRSPQIPDNQAHTLKVSTSAWLRPSPW